MAGRGPALPFDRRGGHLRSRSYIFCYAPPLRNRYCMMADNQALAPLVERLGGRAPLSADDRKALLALPHQERLVGPGGYVVEEGEVMIGWHVQLSGVAHRHRISADGMRHIVGMHGPGDFLNLPVTPPATSEDFVQALTRVRVAVVQTEDVLALSQGRIGIFRAICGEIAADISIYRAWISNVGRREARARIAYLLCELVMRSHPGGGADGCSITLPMSQVEIADATGITTVHVNRTLRAMQAQGIIRRHRRNIYIPDWRALTRIAEFRPAPWASRMVDDRSLP
jgi:CRP-like cAMP-binding protein